VAICRCGLPAHCCQPALAGGIIYADLWGELNTHLAPTTLFTQSSPVCKPLLQAFLFPSTLGEVTLHPLSQACVFIYSSRGKWVFPPLLWSFPPSTTLTSFPAPGCWARTPAPTLSGQAWLVYLQFWEGFPSPLFSAQGAPPSLLRVFIVLIAYYSVSLFSAGGGWSIQGAMLVWPRIVCGSTVYRLAHLVRVFPSCLGKGVWWPGGPLVCLFNVKWRCSAPAGGVEGSNFCLFSVALPAMCVSSISPRFHYRRHAFCFLPLATILEFCGFLCLVLIALIKLLNFVTLTFTNFKNYWLLSV
jgi:hypothetical protein